MTDVPALDPAADSTHEAAQELVGAMTAALPDPFRPGHPGRLRRDLEAALGSGGPLPPALRRDLHQVLAAAEEHVPTRMAQAAPLTTATLARLRDELAAARGWRTLPAERATRLWARALGFDRLAAQAWPGPAASPVDPVDPVPPAASPVEPTTSSAPPPAPAQPPSIRPSISPSISSISPSPGPSPSPWPATPTRLVEAGIAPPEVALLGATQAYAGVSLTGFVAGIGALTAVLCGLAVVLPTGAAGVVAAAGAAAAAWLRRYLGFGALVATPDGLTFVPFEGNMREPRPAEAHAVAWEQVGAEPGRVSRMDLGGRRVQIGPRNRAFADAVAARAGRSADVTP